MALEELDDFSNDELEDLPPVMPAVPIRVRGLVDDFDSTELQDVSGIDTTSFHSSLLDEPVEDEAVEEDVDPDAPVASFGQDRDPGIGDAFEDFIRHNRKHKPLSFDETDRLVRLAAEGSPDEQRDAEDRLVRHNAKWIVRAMRESLRDKSLLDRPNDIRTALLSEACRGFLMAIRNFSNSRAQEGAEREGGRTKSLHGYSRYWIRKYVTEHLYPEQYNLAKDAALARGRIMKARSALARQMRSAGTGSLDEMSITAAQIAEFMAAEAAAKLAPDLLRQEMGREPTGAELEEFAVAARNAIREQALLEKARESVPLGRDREQRVRETLASDYEWNKLQRMPRRVIADADLRRAGAIHPKRVQELLEHHTTVYSLDQPTGDEDGRTTLDVYASNSVAVADADMTRSDLEDTLDREIERIPGFRSRWLLRLAAGLRLDNGANPGHWAPDEAAVATGLTQETVDIINENSRNVLSGTEDWDVSSVLPEGGSFTIKDIQSMLRTPGGVPANILAEIVDEIDLRKVVHQDGIQTDSYGGRPVECVFQPEDGRTLSIDRRRFCCTGCGAEGDVVDWLTQVRGHSRDEAIIEAAHLALPVPPAVRAPGSMRVTVDPARKSRLEGLR
jgi:hypothetical protein